jgi:hypothetical protein
MDQIGVWRSWLARAVWDRQVEGSSPFTPTIQRTVLLGGFLNGLSKDSNRKAKHAGSVLRNLCLAERVRQLAGCRASIF